MELSQSDERFLVPDSEDEELNNCEPWDLILGLKALAAARRQLLAKQQAVMEKDQGKSPKKKKQSIFPSFESEDNASEPQAALAYDTISSDSGSGNSRDKQNDTVIERRPPTPSEYIGSLQLSQQAMLVPETMESLSESGPSPQVSHTGPFIVPDSPSQDHQDSSSSSKEKGGLEVDEEITFNPRLLSTLASQSVDDGKEGSQCLHLRLSPSQPESMQSSGPIDQFEELPSTSSKAEAMPTTPIKNPQMTLSCRKLSLKDPSPSKHQTSLLSKASFEMPSVRQIFLDEDDIEIPPKEKQGEKDLLKSGNVNEDSSVVDSCKSSRPAQNLELFLDTDEEEARRALGTGHGKSGSSREAREKDAAEYFPSWKEERNLRRQKRREKLMKLIGKASDDEDAGKDEEKDGSHVERKEKPKTSIDEAASLVIIEEQDSAVMVDEHTLSYEYVRPLDPDEDVDVIKSSLPKPKAQYKDERTIVSQSEGEFHGFEKGEDEDPLGQAQSEEREFQNVENMSSLPEPMETEQNEGDEHHPEKHVTSDVQSQGVRVEVVSEGTPYKRDVTVRLSEGSTLVETTVQDPYTFYGSQSQNIADVSAQPVSEKPKKIKKIKEMRKVLKKKAPLKQNMTSSSTDDADPSKLAVKSLKSAERRKQKSAIKQSKKQTKTQMAQNKKDAADVSEVAQTLASSSRSATLMPPPVAESSTKASPGQDAQTLTVPTGSLAEKSNRKGATVSFSDEHASKGGTLVQESSDHAPGERERKTVREVMALVITRETTTEIFDSKGQLVRHNVISEVVRRTVLEPPWPSTEVHVSEQIFSPGLSPSRSASTVTSGDLADVSSSSLSRTLSSGSKGSNPSLDAGIHSYPTPAQRTRSMEQTDPSGHDDEYIPATSLATNVTTAGAGKVDTKRLSSGSNTGQDLFGTPNESMIARCDLSHVGTVIPSSHSTPVVEPQPHCSHQVAPSTTSTADNGNMQDEMKTRTMRTKESHKAVVEEEEHNKKERKGEEEESLQVRTLGKGKQKKGDTSAQSKSKNKGKRTAKETETATEMSESARKRPRAEKELEEMEVEKDEEKGGSGISTGFVVQGGAADSPATKGDAQAPSRSESPETMVTDVSERSPVELVDIKSKFEIGEQVMGRWNDGCFYPGVLKKMELHNQRFQVRFDDGTQKWVDASGLLLAKELPVGQSVMVMSTDGYYECGMIMKHTLEPLKEKGKVKVIYHVERDDQVTQKCERGRLLLSEDQAACLLTDENLSLSAFLLISPAKIGDISLDNLVEGKRKPKPTKEQPSTSSGQEKLSTSLDTSVPGVGANEAPSTRRRPQGPVATSTPTPKQTSRIAKSSNGSSVKHSKVSPLGGVVSSPLARRKSSRVRLDLFGSNIQPKSDLFKGKAFLITHIEKTEQQRAEEKKLLQDSSLDTSADDNVEEDTEYHPFVKDQLNALIKTGGGEVMESYDEEKIKKIGKHNCYVIASEHQCTVKYLQGLASGLTLVSHEWILHSVAQNRILGLRAFLLPSGISLEKKRLIEWKGPCMALVGMTMMVVSNREDFTEVWTSILKIAGCHLISKFPPRASKIDPGMDYVIADLTCPANVIRKCRTLEVPVVSSEWVAQCFINNYLVEPNAHEQYKHDYETL